MPAGGDDSAKQDVIWSFIAAWLAEIRSHLARSLPAAERARLLTKESRDNSSGAL